MRVFSQVSLESKRFISKVSHLQLHISTLAHELSRLQPQPHRQVTINGGLFQMFLINLQQCLQRRLRRLIHASGFFHLIMVCGSVTCFIHWRLILLQVPIYDFTNHTFNFASHFEVPDLSTRYRTLTTNIHDGAPILVAYYPSVWMNDDKHVFNLHIKWAAII